MGAAERNDLQGREATAIASSADLTKALSRPEVDDRAVAPSAVPSRSAGGGLAKRLLGLSVGNVSILLFLAAWEAVARSGLTSGIYLPSVSGVVTVYLELVTTGEIFQHISASMSRALIGLALAFVTATTLALAMGWSKPAHRFLNPLVEMFRPIPPIALIPLSIYWFGIGDASKVFIIFIACFFPILLNTLSGIRGVDPLLVSAAVCMGARRIDVFWKVVLPAASPHILTSLRISSGIAMIVLVASEMVAAISGLGYLILFAERTFQTEKMFAGIITISLISLCVNAGLIQIERRYMSWYFRR